MKLKNLENLPEEKAAEGEKEEKTEKKVRIVEDQKITKFKNTEV